MYKSLHKIGRLYMAYIHTIPEEEAENLLSELYQNERIANGYVPNYAKAMSLNPEAYEAWKKLISSVRSRMRLRRYELVTFATALELKCTY
jgi:hypothetical protein